MKQEPSWKMLSALRKVLKGEIYVSDEMGSKILNKFVSNKLEPSGSLLDSLSNREVEIYQLIGQGLRRQEIADRLNLSIRTIETYIEHIKKKMKFSHNHEVVTHAFKNAVKL